MTDFGSFEAQAQALAQPLSQTEKAAAVLLAMGKSIAGKLLKFFTQSELQAIIAAAQSLRAVPPHELEALVNEFEDLFTEGAGLMDNAKAMESILEEGLTPDEVDGLLGRRATFQSYEASIWDRLMDCDPVIIAQLLAREHPQTIAYVLSMMPSSFGAKVLLQLSDKQRPRFSTVPSTSRTSTRRRRRSSRRGLSKSSKRWRPIATRPARRRSPK